MVDRTVHVLNNNWATFLPPLQTLPPVVDSRHCSQELEVRVGWARFLQRQSANAQQNDVGQDRTQRISTSKQNLSEGELASGNWNYTGFSSCNDVKDFMEQLERIEHTCRPFAVSDWEYSEDCFYDAVSSLLPLAENITVVNNDAADGGGEAANGQVTKQQLEEALKRSRLRQTMGDSFSVVSFTDADDESGRRWFTDWMLSNKGTHIVSKHQMDATMWAAGSSDTAREHNRMCMAPSVMLKTRVLDVVECAKFRPHLNDLHLQWSIETQLANVSFSRLPVATDPKSPSSSVLSASRQLKLCQHAITTTRIKRRKSLFFSRFQIRQLLYSHNGEQSPVYESDADRVRDMFTPTWRVDFTVCWRSSLPNGQSLQAARREAANFAVDALSAALVQPSYEIELECMSVADETEHMTQRILSQSPDMDAAMSSSDLSSKLQHDATRALIEQAAYLSKLLFVVEPVNNTPWRRGNDYRTMRVR